MAFGTDGLLENILFEIGRILVLILLALAAIVARLFGLDTAPIVAAREAICAAEFTA